MAGGSIRPARRRDRPRILALCDRTFRQHQERNPADFPAGGPNHAAAFLPGAFSFWRRRARGLLVSESGGALCGYILFRRYGSVVMVLDIGVDEGFQRTGEGRRLIEAMLAEVGRDRRAQLVTATVWAGNAASEALFSAAGFRPAAREYRYNLRDGSSNSG